MEIDTPQLKKRKMSPEVASLPAAPEQPFRVKRLSENAKLPTRGSALAAGYDLYSAERKVVPAHGKALVDTQLSIAVPPGTYGRVAPRSGLASKFMIDTGAGVVDADYRGIIFVLLFNHSDKDFQVEEGDRIAQIIFEKICTPEVLEVDDLGVTDRGANGFGSTGGHSLLNGKVETIIPVSFATERGTNGFESADGHGLLNEKVETITPVGIATERGTNGSTNGHSI